MKIPTDELRALVNEPLEALPKEALTAMIRYLTTTLLEGDVTSIDGSPVELRDDQ